MNKISVLNKPNSISNKLLKFKTLFNKSQRDTLLNFIKSKDTKVSK